MLIAAGLALYSFLVAVFMTLFVASSRGDLAMEEHFAGRRSRPRRRDKARNVG